MLNGGFGIADTVDIDSFVDVNTDPTIERWKGHSDDVQLRIDSETGWFQGSSLYETRSIRTAEVLRVVSHQQQLSAKMNRHGHPDWPRKFVTSSKHREHR